MRVLPRRALRLTGTPGYATTRGRRGSSAMSGSFHEAPSGSTCTGQPAAPARPTSDCQPWGCESRPSEMSRAPATTRPRRRSDSIAPVRESSTRELGASASCSISSAADPVLRAASERASQRTSRPEWRTEASMARRASRAISRRDGAAASSRTGACMDADTSSPTIQTGTCASGRRLTLHGLSSKSAIPSAAKAPSNTQQRRDQRGSARHAPRQSQAAPSGSSSASRTASGRGRRGWRLMTVGAISGNGTTTTRSASRAERAPAAKARAPRGSAGRRPTHRPRPLHRPRQAAAAGAADP